MSMLKTDERLLNALHAASQWKATPGELRAQRVSFIIGALKEESGVTRSRIDEVLAEQEGLQ